MLGATHIVKFGLLKGAGEVAVTPPTSEGAQYTIAGRAHYTIEDRAHYEVAGRAHYEVEE